MNRQIEGGRGEKGEGGKHNLKTILSQRLTLNTVRTVYTKLHVG